jgi:nitrous oxidase accessory protein NosD
LVSILAVLLLIVGPMVLSSSPQPREIRVPQDFPTIQEAIDHAVPGSVIHITPGTYQENLIVDRPLALRGEGQDQVIIGGGEGCREGRSVILVSSQDVRIEELTITRCSIGIGIRGAAELIHLALTGNGIGLEIWDSARAYLENSSVSDNTVGIEIWALAEAAIADSVLEENGIGVKVLRGSSVALINDRITQNGLGIEVWDSDEVLVEGSVISENEGDGLWVWGPATTRVALHANRIEKNGGNGLRLGAAPYRPDSLRAEIEDNVIQENQGCGVWVDEADGAEIRLTGRGNSISGNTGGDLCPPPPAYPWPSDLIGAGGS